MSLSAKVMSELLKFWPKLTPEKGRRVEQDRGKAGAAVTLVTVEE